MSQPDTVKNFRDGKINLLDGAALDFEIDKEVGDFSFSEVKEAQITVMDRGIICGERKGNEQLVTGSFTCHARAFTDDTGATVRDVINRLKSWAAATSTGGTGFEHFMHNIRYTMEGTNLGDTADHVITITKAILELDFTEGDLDSFTVNFTGYVPTLAATGQL